jgi:radical SAM superfamily enzyme YgiQ (UPF0313 family)
MSVYTVDRNGGKVNILMVYPQFPDTFWSFKHALEFINKKINNPPLGLMTISALLPKNWSKKLIDTNIHELTDEDLGWADMVFVSAMDVQRADCKKVIHRAKSFGKTVIAGGPLFTTEYSNFPEVDHFILNEGELTLPLLLKDIENGIKPKHIYSMDDFADMHDSPLPDISLINIFEYECMSIQFSRGCPFQCDFCNVTALLGHKMRLKTTAQIIAELEQYYRAGWSRNVFFVDDNFIGNKKYLKEDVLPAIIAWRKGKKGFNFITEASINMADDPELLRLMSEAGFTSVFVGIETPNENSLIECGKKQNTKRDLIESIHKIHNAGIQVMAGFIVGFDQDTPTIFDDMINFIQESGIVTAMVGLLQAPGGTKLYHRLEGEGRILHEMSGDNTDGSTNIIPKMDPLVLKKGYIKIINTIYSPKYLYPRIKTLLKAYHPIKTPGQIYANEVSAFFKAVWRMGLKRGESRYFWDLVFWSLFNCPSKFALGVSLTIYGYHFRKVNAINQRNDALAAKKTSKGFVKQPLLEQSTRRTAH